MVVIRIARCHWRRAEPKDCRSTWRGARPPDSHLSGRMRWKDDGNYDHVGDYDG